MAVDINVGIIGGGIAGLSCGYELMKRGVKVTILEKEERVGGRHRSEVYDGHIVDVGAVFFSPAFEPNFFGYFRELDIEDELNVPPISSKNFGLYYSGKVIPLTKPSITLSGLYPFSDLRKLGKFESYMKNIYFSYHRFGSEQLRNHEMSIADFFRARGFSDKFKDRFVQPFTAMYYVSPEEISAACALRLMAHSSAVNIKPKSGISIVTKTLHQRLGDGVVTGAEATKVTQGGGGFTITYKTDEQFKDLRVDVLVLAMPTFISNKLVPQLNIKMDYSVACTEAVRGRLRSKFRKFLGILIPRADNPSNVFSIMMDKEDTEVSVVHIYQKPYDLSPYYEEGYEVIKEFYWVPTLPTPRPGSVFPNLETEIENLYICGDFYRYPCCEAATVSGKRVADMIYARSVPDPRKSNLWRF